MAADASESTPPGKTRTVQVLESTNGVQLATYDFGGSGPMMLLAHATGFHGRVYRALANELAADYHSVALDYRGHGDSSPPADNDFNWHGYGHDTSVFTKYLDAQPLFAFGHSMGGAALLMAELDAPGTFAGLVVFEPIVMPAVIEIPQGQGNFLAAGARKRRSTFASFDAAFDNYRSKPPLSGWDASILRDYVEYGLRDDGNGGVTLKCTGENEALTYEMGGTHGTFERLNEVTCPVLVLAGTIDGEGPAAMAETIAVNLKNGLYKQFDQLTHFGPMEAPSLIAATITEYFAGLD